MSEKCRLCFKEGFELASIFQYRNGQLVADLIESIFPEIIIERSDKHPKLICVKCLTIVSNACELRDLVRKNLNLHIDNSAVGEVKAESFENIVKQEIFEEFDTSMQPIVTIKETNSSDIFDIKPSLLEIIESSNKKSNKKQQSKSDERFYCFYCNHYLTSNSMLTAHIKIHHPLENRGKFKCDYCELKGKSKIFKLKTSIEHHMQSVHGNTSNGHKEPNDKKSIKKSSIEKNLFCEICHIFFGARSSYNKHYRHFHPQLLLVTYKCRKQQSFEKHKKRTKRPYKPINRKLATTCDVCFLVFKTRADMRLHRFIHCDFVGKIEETEPQTFTCALCPFHSYFEEEIAKHLPIHKSDFTQQAVLVCLRCSWTFQDYTVLEKHTELHNMKITHRCLRCSKKFSYGPKFLRHIERHLSYTCDLCGSNESSKGRLEDHIKVAHMKVVCHLCPICGESKKTSGSLQSHIKAKHETERKYQCTLCAKSFLTPTYLRNHQSVHSNELNFPCQKCPKKFRTYRNLKRHQVYHDPSKLNYKHVCDQDGCGRSFLNKFGLDRHMLTHTGLRPWICTVAGCDRAFSQSNDLNKHLRSHYGDCIYNCDFPGCSMAFKLKGELREHQTDHYKK